MTSYDEDIPAVKFEISQTPKEDPKQDGGEGGIRTHG